MAVNLFVAPTGRNCGLTSVCLGLVRALDAIGIRVGFYKPIGQTPRDQQALDRSVTFVRARTALNPPDPLPLKQAQELLNKHRSEMLMEDIVGFYERAASGFDVMVIEGLVPDSDEPYTARLNVELARNLSADVILVSAPTGQTPAELDQTLDFSSRLFAQPEDPDVIGAILNKVGAPRQKHVSLESVAAEPGEAYDWARECRMFASGRLKLLGVVPWKPDLLAPRMADIASYLDADVLNEGQLFRRVHRLSVSARTLPNMVQTLRPGTLLVTPGDREDIILAAAMAALSGVPLAGLLLTGNLVPDERVMQLCRPALESGLPVLRTGLDTYHTAYQLAEMGAEVPSDDLERIENVMDAVASYLDTQWLQDHFKLDREPRLSPPAFRHRLAERARKANKRIVLPEGNEPRTIQAAAICHQRGLARCVLIGKRDEILSVADSQGVSLPEDITIIDPDSVRDNYVQPMVDLRSHKGLAPDMAAAQLEDNVVLATMMVALGEMDGLVSGAVHTTANTIRPAMQLIKTHEDARVVSSVFFMCLPEQVLVYGDCAVNPDPDAETLADIAVQSAASAETFGIVPRVAMISYSTGESGAGADVEKVRQATDLARKRRPELAIDGPLQYDAAAIEEVARSKAPDSPVAGKATVFVFPDLNTGNTTYKAVQRSANVVSIGPMLQGLRKPVNDLSRGAMIEDIVFTIALTAVQAEQAEAQTPPDTGQPGSGNG